MRLTDEQLSNRIRSCADETVDLIYYADSLSDEMSQRGGEIIADSELDEEEVVRRIKSLI